jgi:hypothetical protein
MKFETKYLRISELFENAIKYTLKFQLCVECPETTLNTVSSLTISAPKHCLLPFAVPCYTPLC